MDARVIHLSVHIHPVTTVYQILQSTYCAYSSVADSGQVGRKIVFSISVHPKFYLNVLWTDKQYQHQQQKAGYSKY